MELDIILVIGFMFLSNSVLTIVTWYYILNKMMDNIKETLGEVKDVVNTVKQ